MKLRCRQFCASRQMLLLNHLINFAWLMRVLDKKECDCKTALDQKNGGKDE